MKTFSVMPYIRSTLIAWLLLMTPLASADWINLTGAETSSNIAEIYVLDDHVKLVLEVYVGDLETFDELLPDASGDEVAAEPHTETDPAGAQDDAPSASDAEGAVESEAVDEVDAVGTTEESGDAVEADADTAEAKE